MRRNHLQWLIGVLLTLTPLVGSATEGDTVDDPIWIESIPIELTGSTCGFEFDYDEPCPYGGSAPDVVYAYAALETSIMDLSLCLSSYDTKIIIYDDPFTWGSPIYCNDDWCLGPNGTYLSHLEDVVFEAGTTYYIVVTGYASYCGDYILQIEENGPCGIDWPGGGYAEGEPDCVDDYYDDYNGGCNTAAHAFQVFESNPYWPVLVAGRSGTYLGAGNPKRDSDWYQINPATWSDLVISCRAEFPLQLYLIDGGGGCGDMVELGADTAETCGMATIHALVPPGTYWIWVGPSVTSGVPCGATYALTIDGYHDDATAAPESDAPADLSLVSLTNPARQGAEFQFSLDAPTHVTLSVYDVAGRLLRTLVDELEQAGGTRRCDWDGRDAAGVKVGAGVYFVRLRAGERGVTEKLVLLR